MCRISFRKEKRSTMRTTVKEMTLVICLFCEIASRKSFLIRFATERRKITELKCCARAISFNQSTLETGMSDRSIKKRDKSHLTHDRAKTLFNFESTFTRFGLFSSSFVRFFQIIYSSSTHVYFVYWTHIGHEHRWRNTKRWTYLRFKCFSNFQRKDIYFCGETIFSACK